MRVTRDVVNVLVSTDNVTAFYALACGHRVPADRTLGTLEVHGAPLVSHCPDCAVEITREVLAGKRSRRKAAEKGMNG